MSGSVEHKFCKDCRYSEEVSLYPHCNHPTSAVPSRIDLVTGEEIPERKMHCYTARMLPMDDITCGPDARWFESKEPEE